jgi:hypothetical protein
MGWAWVGLASFWEADLPGRDRGAHGVADAVIALVGQYD